MAEEPKEVTLDDVDRAIASIPAPTCYADYGRQWRVLPGGGVEEIVRKTPQTSDKGLKGTDQEIQMQCEDDKS